jgi:4'-phosphopantetheinyl transferase
LIRANSDPDTVTVRWVAVAAVDPGTVSRWRFMLDAEERRRADSYRFARDRNLFIAAHALLRTMLSDATGCSTASWRYVNGEHGKPALAGAGAECGLHFNLCHTDGYSACAVSRYEVGLDIEASDRPTNLDLSRQVFSPGEASLAQSDANLFFRFWTLKEAFIKATGEGLHRPFDSFSFRFDPVRIAFHPGRENTPCSDDPDTWQFAECRPAPYRPLAVAVRCPDARPMRLDMGATEHDHIAPRPCRCQSVRSLSVQGVGRHEIR